MSACGNKDCGVSTGICDSLTFGSGYLDDHGYWNNPCWTCARDWEKNHPDEECWPFEAKSPPKDTDPTWEEQSNLWQDTEDEWSDAINAAHPMCNGSHETYAIAMQMVGNRHSKAALVELVNWLLQQRG